MSFRSINPATLEVLGEYPSLTEEGVLGMVATAGEAFRKSGGWASLSVAQRGDRLAEVGRIIRSRAEELAQLATTEMGKPIRQSRAEVEKCASGLEFVGGKAPIWLMPERREERGAVRFEPLGVLLAVMPWNFPYWQIVRFCCGALAAGNCVMIKPAPSTVGCALSLEKCFREAGLGAGVYSTLLAEVDDLEVAVADEAVAAVSLTGSVKAGRALAAVAARHGKPAVLELGGSDPFVVLEDADVSAAAKAAAAARCLNSGQSCIAAKRFIAVGKIYDAFKQAFVAEMQALKVGDPADETTDVGPLARGDLREALVDQLLAAKAKGATALCKGGPIDGMGYYFAPEILELSVPEGPAWVQETFGPLAALIRADDETQAISLANTTRFGLGASVWTRSGRAGELAPLFQAGNVFFNDTVKSLPGLPFGGIKDSGMGRELGVEGMRAFTNIKTVWGE